MSEEQERAVIALQKSMRGNMARRKTLKATQDGQLGGFIRVFMRFRPLGEGRGERGERIGIDPQMGRITVKPPKSAGEAGRAKKADDTTHFDFERVCTETDDNETMLHMVGKPLVESVCIGYHGTLFAYGQTGSGKTYTIGEMSKLGTPHEGIAHRMVRHLYQEAFAMGVRSFKVQVQFVQIYIEHVHDLLCEPSREGPSASAKLQLREDKERGVYIEGATTVPAATADECLAVLERASKNLKFAATRMNRHSSRSHAVCRLLVEMNHSGTSADKVAAGMAPPSLSASVSADLGAPPADGGPADLDKWRRRSVGAMQSKLEQRRAKTTNATLTLCDLAGSEDVGRSGAAGTALAEAQKINTSLLALGNVIQALTTSKSGTAHVPFRNSALTRILQQSIGGDCKTCLIVCASPADGDVTETLSTLRFASRAKRVKNVAKIHAVMEPQSTENTAALAEELQAHLDAEKTRLEAARAKSEQTAAGAISLALKLALRYKVAQKHTLALEAGRVALEEAKAEALRHAKVSEEHEEQADEERELVEEAKQRVEEENAKLAADKARLEEHMRRLEGELREAHRAREDASRAFEREADAREADAEGAAAEATRALKAAEARAAQAKKEADALRAAHAQEVGTTRDEFRKQMEALRAEHAAALAARAKEAESATAAVAAEKAAAAEREAELSQLVASASEASKDDKTSFKQLVAWQKAGRVSAVTRLTESQQAARKAEEALKAKAAAELHATVEAARAEERAAAAAALREAAGAAEQLHALALDRAIKEAVDAREEELREAYAVERTRAVATAKAEGRAQADASAKEREGVANRAAEGRLRAAVQAAEAAMQAGHVAALARAKSGWAAELDAAVDAERVKMRAAQQSAVAAAAAQAHAEAQVVAETAAYDAAAALEAAHAHAALAQETRAAEAAQQLSSMRAERDESAATQCGAHEASTRARADADKAAAACADAKAALAEMESKVELLERQLEESKKNERERARAAVLKAEEAHASHASRLRREQDVRDEYHAALAQNAAGAQAKEAELQRRLDESIAEGRMAAEEAASLLAAEKQRLHAELRGEQLAALDKARRDAAHEFEAKMQESLAAMRSESAGEVERHMRLRKESDAAAATLREELQRAQGELSTALADSKAVERRHASAVQTASSNASRSVSEAVARVQAQADAERAESIAAVESELRAEMAVAVSSARAMAEAETHAASEVLQQEHAAKLSALEAAVATARTHEQRVAVERIAPLENEIIRLSSDLEMAREAHEAAAARARMELRASRESAAQNASGLDATIEKLKEAHAAALARVRSSHETALATERHARAEAERMSHTLVVQQHSSADSVHSPPRRLRDASVDDGALTVRTHATETIRELEREAIELRRKVEVAHAEVGNQREAKSALQQQLQAERTESMRLRGEREQLAHLAESVREELALRESRFTAAAASETGEWRAKAVALTRRVELAESDAESKGAQLAALRESVVDEGRQRTQSVETMRELSRELDGKTRQLDEVRLAYEELRRQLDEQRLGHEAQMAEQMAQRAQAAEEARVLTLELNGQRGGMDDVRRQAEEQVRVHERRVAELSALSQQTAHEQHASAAEIERHRTLVDEQRRQLEEVWRQAEEQRRLHAKQTADAESQLVSATRLARDAEARAREMNEVVARHEATIALLSGEREQLVREARGATDAARRESEGTVTRLHAQLEEQKRVGVQREQLVLDARAAAEHVRHDAEASMAKYDAQLADKSRRLAHEKERLAADNTAVQLEGARLAAQNIELQARADQLSRRLMTSEQQLALEQSKSLSTLSRLSASRGSHKASGVSSLSMLAGLGGPPSSGTTPTGETSERVFIRSPAPASAAPSYFSWREGPAPSPPILSTYSTSPPNPLHPRPHSVTYSVAPE